MPERLDFEALMRIRDTASRTLDPQVPLIAMTANSTKGKRERCPGVGTDDYPAKPVQPREMVVVIEQNLSRVLPNKDRPADAAQESAPGTPGGQ